MKKQTKKSSIKKASAPIKETVADVKKNVEKVVRPIKHEKVLRMATPLLIGLATGLILSQLYDRLQPAAIVNGQLIPKQSITQDLYKQGGDKILDNKINEMLILQEAKKRNVQVTSQELDKRIKTVEDQVKASGQNIDSLLAAQGQTRDDFMYQMKLQIYIEKMFGKDVTVTDQEARDYFDKNKETFGADATFESKAKEIKSGLKNQKLAEKFQTWLTTAKSKAKITNYLQSKK